MDHGRDIKEEDSSRSKYGAGFLGGIWESSESVCDASERHMGGL
jgi:hypothetical protein